MIWVSFNLFHSPPCWSFGCMHTWDVFCFMIQPVVIYIVTCPVHYIYSCELPTHCYLTSLINYSQSQMSYSIILEVWAEDKEGACTVTFSLCLPFWSTWPNIITITPWQNPSEGPHGKPLGIKEIKSYEDYHISHTNNKPGFQMSTYLQFS